MSALCLNCGAAFAKRKASSRFCSKRCSGLHQSEQRRANGEHVARFWGNVERRGEGECWPWQAGKVEGYGQIRFAGEKLGSHVVAFRLVNGSVPDGLMVLHRCGNRACCNPAHLYAGNHSENTSDAVRHGTHKCNFGLGEGHIASKLSPAEVIEIRDRLVAGERQRVIAAEFGVAQDTISSIRLGKTWRHV